MTDTRPSGDEPSEPSSSGASPEPSEPASNASAPKSPGKLQQLIMDYGVTAVVVLLSLSALSYLGFFFAFMVGFEVEGAGATAGASAAALAGWAATKPIRIPLAIALTPLVATIWRRLRGRTKDEARAQDATGQDATGQDATGQDATGQDATGQDATG